jgi:hypothetical protein
MWIAACCLTHGIPLATLNLKDYEDFGQQIEDALDPESGTPPYRRFARRNTVRTTCTDGTEPCRRWR